MPGKMLKPANHLPSHRHLGAIFAGILLSFASADPRLIGEVFVEPPANKKSAGENDLTRDAIDARIPKDPQVDALWDASQLAIRDQNWKQVSDLQQKLLDYPEDAMIESAPGHWESVRTAANRVLRTAPPHVLAEYEQQYGGLAQQLLQQATGPETVTRLVEVASRYFHTDAGATAAAKLAVWHFDQREYIPATRWNRELLECDWKGTADLRWKLQAALTARQAGLADLKPFLADWFDESQQIAVLLGDQNLTVEQWWAQPSSPEVIAPQPTDWKQFGGSNLRWATASPEQPLLLRNWGRSLVSSPSLGQRMRRMLDDINDQGLPLIPAASPVVVGDIVAYRDLRGVVVLDRHTGKTRWRTEEGISPERILNGVPTEGQGSDNAWRVRVGAAQYDEEFFGESAEMHPLASWLFRDATNAFISSDGERLYVLEDVAVMTRHQSGYFGDDDPDGADPFGATWSSNRLSAYHLDTGRLAWTVGGPDSSEATSLPLAGSFFFGVPSIDKHELYVVASSGQEIRLQALDPETGRPRWSQLLAFSDTKIELDIPRRWLSAPVAIHEGLIVCPTTVGWLVAVDQTRRAIAWVQRYQPKSEDPELDPASQFVPQRSLNETWCVGAPVISGNSVLIATPEVDRLMCFDLLDGHLRWSRERDDGRYLATVTPDTVVVAGYSQIAAFNLTDGKPLWSTNWEDDEQPIGRGVRLGNTLAIPLSSDELVYIDIATGKRQQTVPTPPDMSLGNLVKVGHQFLSLGWSGCQAFSEQDSFLKTLTERQAQQPDDPQTLLQLAEYAQLHQDHLRMVNLLSAAASDNWPTKDREKQDQLLWSSYQMLVKSQPDRQQNWMTALESLARTPQRQLELLSIQVDQHVSHGQLLAAFKQLWQAAETQPPSDALMTCPENAQIQISTANWIAGRMATLWESSRDQDRRELDNLIQQRIDQSLAKTIDDQLATWPWVKFHPAATRLAWTISATWVKGHYLDRAEVVLKTGLLAPDLASRLETELRLARLQRLSGLPADNITRLQQLAALYPNETLPSGMPLLEAIQKGRLTPSVDSPISALEALHRQLPLTMLRLPAGHQPAVQELVPPETSPYYGMVTFQLEPENQRIAFYEQQTGKLLRMTPLRALAQSPDMGYSPYQFLGQRLLILHRNVLQMISLSNGQVVWSTAISQERAFDWEGHRPEPESLTETDDFYDEPGYWKLQNFSQGRLVFANDVAIGVLEQRGFSVYDQATGKILWKHLWISPYSQVLGTREVVLVADTDDDSVQAFRTRDGSPLEIPDLAARLKRALAIVDDDLIAVETKPGIQLFALDTRRLSIQRQDLRTGQVIWNVEIRNGSQLGTLGSNSLMIVGPARAALQNRYPIEVLNLTTGAIKGFDPLPIPQSAESLLPLQDAERLYLVVNNNDYSDNYGDSLSSTHVDGLIVAWDHQTGRMLWRTAVEEQNLALDRFVDSPFLLCLSREWKQVAQASYTKLHLLAIDKVTGHVRLRSESPASFGGFHGIKVHPAEGSVELTSYNLRLKLSPRASSLAAADFEEEADSQTEDSDR